MTTRQRNPQARTPTIYISGSISGRKPQEYKAHFAKAGERLSAMGYQVINPLNNGLNEGDTWHAHMRADIRLLTYCDEIFMLDGWERSKGATAEHALAEALGILIHYEKPRRRPELKQAILVTLGVTVKELCERNRRRPVVYARIIYAYLASREGDSLVTIAKELDTKHSTASYYLRQYPYEFKYNKEFRTAALAVAELLAFYKNQDNQQ